VLTAQQRHTRLRLEVPRDDIASLRGPLQPKEGHKVLRGQVDDARPPCSTPAHTHTYTHTHRHTECTETLSATKAWCWCCWRCFAARACHRRRRQPPPPSQYATPSTRSPNAEGRGTHHPRTARGPSAPPQTPRGLPATNPASWRRPRRSGQAGCHLARHPPSDAPRCGACTSAAPSLTPTPPSCGSRAAPAAPVHDSGTAQLQ
jgi:hypothetical protein